MSTLFAINELAAARPAAEAPSTVVAAWYERKAVVLHQIAEASGSSSEHDRFESLSAQAHGHAVRLWTLGR